MISICTSNPDPRLVAEFRAWVEAEWKEVDPFFGQNEKTLPTPILALEDGELVGGLSFTYASIPGTQDVALWINTVLVAPKLRRSGIGSKLISAAERCAAPARVDELYVFTEIASLYQKLGWHIHSSTEGGTVLRKKITADPDNT